MVRAATVAAEHDAGAIGCRRLCRLLTSCEKQKHEQQHSNAFHGHLPITGPIRRTCLSNRLSCAPDINGGRFHATAVAA